MIRLRRVTGLAVAILALALPLGASAETVKHSGTIAAVDEKAGTFLLSEVGPWKVRQGATVITPRTIVVTDATEFVALRRVDQAPSGFARDFIEEKLPRWAVAQGDFVTAETVQRDSRLIAVKVTLVRPERP